MQDDAGYRVGYHLPRKVFLTRSGKRRSSAVPVVATGTAERPGEHRDAPADPSSADYGATGTVIVSDTTPSSRRVTVALVNSTSVMLGVHWLLGQVGVGGSGSGRRLSR